MLFPKLQPYSIQIDRIGKKHKVKLLPIRLLDRYYEILKDVEKNINAKSVVEGRKKLRMLAMRVLPETFKDDLMFLSFEEMSILVGELFYGNIEISTAVKRNKEDSADLDYEFAAVRLMYFFPSYTLENILEMPPPVFFRLLEMLPRIFADDALYKTAPAVSAAVNGGEAQKHLKKLHGGYLIQHFSDYTPEELAAAYKRTKKATRIKKQVKLGSRL